MSEFIVLGAGMAGVGAALALQAQGHAVTLLDRAAPGSETSHGNAGVIQAEAVEPYAMPRDAATLLAYAAGRSNDVLWHPGAVARMAPALARYFHSSAPARHRLIARAYAQLIHRATADHAPLIAASGSAALIRHTGMGELYRDARRFEAAARHAERIRADHGVPSQLLSGADLATAEPALRPGTVQGMVHWTDSWSCADPGALTRAYADLFAARGGQVLRGEAMSLRQGKGGWAVEGAEGPIEGSDVVIALGPWSPDLLARLGYRLPMVWKRGYHGHYETGATLQRPCLDAANGYVMSTMARGLRITTGAELTDRAAPPNLRQLTRARQAAGELIEIGAPVADGIWHGHRPCLPGMLPMVGAVPGTKGLWLDTGHGHQGFTLGPTTGALLAEIVAGRADALTEATAVRLGRR